MGPDEPCPHPIEISRLSNHTIILADITQEHDVTLNILAADKTKLWAIFQWDVFSGSYIGEIPSEKKTQGKLSVPNRGNFAQMNKRIHSTI